MNWLELRRQVFHLTNGTIILLLYDHYGKSVGIVILVLTVLGIALSLYHARVKPIGWGEIILKALEREENMRFPGKGAIIYGLGVSLTILIFKGYPVRAAVVALAYGDSFSTIVGKKFGKRRIPWNRRLSVEGSAAFVLATILGGLFFVPPLYAVLAGIIGALVETIPFVDDNLSIPLSVAVVLSIVL